MWPKISFQLGFMLALNLIVVSACIYFALFVYPRRDWTDETKRRPRSFISNAFFREFWYFLMGPLKRKFIEWDISPNTLTWWGFIFSLLAAAAFSQEHFGLGGWMVILAATCDVYDGMLARARNISLKSGAYLDSMLDRLGESCMFVGLVWAFRDDAFWFAIIFMGFTASQMVSYARARAEGLGFSGARGIFQRAERLIVMSIGFGSVVFLEAFEISTIELVKFTLLVLCMGSLETAISRGVEIYREIRKSEVK